MKKFLAKHKHQLITVILSLLLITYLTWDWSHFKSFATGAVIAFAVMRDFFEVSE